MKSDYCRRGHPRTEENTYWDRGARTCRACRNERKRDWARAARGKAPSPKPEPRPLPVGTLVWLVRGGIRVRRQVVGYRGRVVLLGALPEGADR